MHSTTKNSITNRITGEERPLTYKGESFMAQLLEDDPVPQTMKSMVGMPSKTFHGTGFEIALTSPAKHERLFFFAENSEAADEVNIWVSHE
jgi:hypothetical protein